MSNRSGGALLAGLGRYRRLSALMEGSETPLRYSSAMFCTLIRLRDHGTLILRHAFITSPEGEVANDRFVELHFAESDFAERRLWRTATDRFGPWSTHSLTKEAALRLAFRLYGGNPYDTGHSTDPAPTAAMAEGLPSVIWQVSEASRPWSDCFKERLTDRSWPVAAVRPQDICETVRKHAQNYTQVSLV